MEIIMKGLTEQEQAKRELEFEAYYTHPDQIRQAMDYYLNYVEPEFFELEQINILDWSCGSSCAYAKVLLEYLDPKKVSFYQVDIREECLQEMEKIPNSINSICDFSDWEHPVDENGEKVVMHLAITNPPYSLAMEQINKIRRQHCSEETRVIANLPLSYMATSKRRSHINSPKHSITGLLVSGRRMPFSHLSTPSFDVAHICTGTPEFGVVNV